MLKGPAFPSLNHDHDACLGEALKRARLRSTQQGIKWTALREQVFRQIAMSHKPVSAYELIENLSAQGKRLAPVSIYRILDVLQSAGLVHRLESRNAFFACMGEHEGQPQTIVFLCEDCERVTEAEAPDAVNAIVKTTEAGHFHVRSAVLEISGICEECHISSAGNRC